MTKNIGPKCHNIEFIAFLRLPSLKSIYNTNFGANIVIIKLQICCLTGVFLVSVLDEVRRTQEHGLRLR